MSMLLDGPKNVMTYVIGLRTRPDDARGIPDHPTGRQGA